MKVMMERFDTFKLPDVTLGVGIEGNTITIVAQMKRKDGTYEIFHQDQFSTQE
jgi:hypothetical protein